MFWSFLI
ncbi:hypothetical protein Pint_27521 [Pistacia integerrima]|nr:hypothetical protein Pint_27521 [Pistacia integerrima]